MPDETYIYRDFVGSRSYLWDSQVNVPEIRSQEGRLIRPNEYKTMLPHLAVVTVDVVLKLCVPSFVFGKWRLVLTWRQLEYCAHHE